MIVAELSTSWLGDFEILDRMLKVCSDSGFGAVKFQSLSQWKMERHPELDWYYKCSVTKDNISKISNICDEYSMEWFVTPFYKEAVDFLDEYVPYYKIAYADNKNTELIDRCLDTGKNVILSTDRPLDISGNITQIYCIPQYPTDYGSINFDMIRTMKGYSNHCMDPLALLKAKRIGANYIEFHITSDSSRFTIDNKVSYNFGQIEEIMEWIG